MSMEKGKFIVIEGTEYSGKSTQTKLLYKKMQDLGIYVKKTFECTDGPVGNVIRHTYLAGKRKADPKIINILYAADRIDHITNEDDGMLNYINEGISIVSDRYYMSSMALYPLEFWDTPEYKEQMSFIMNLNQTAFDLLRPDLTIFLDVPEEELMSRMEKRSGKKDLFDAPERVSRSVISYYDAIEMLRNEKDEKIIEVNGLGSEHKVHQRIWDVVSKLYTE